MICLRQKHGTDQTQRPSLGDSENRRDAGTRTSLCQREDDRGNARRPRLTQVANVACLPGIVGYSLAMPDIHWGYGFPIGGVAAVDAREGVISPGGVGYDINCGVRLARTHLHFDFVKPRIDRLADALFAKIPAGVGS